MSALDPMRTSPFQSACKALGLAVPQTLLARALHRIVALDVFAADVEQPHGRLVMVAAPLVAWLSVD